MKRRGFLKLLAGASVVLAVKPAKKEKRIVVQKFDATDYYKARKALIEEKANEAMNELWAEEDRRMFKMLGALA